MAGGYLSDRCGGKAVFLVGMVCLSSCSVLLPLLARLSPHLVLLARLVQGAASGLAFPSLYNLFRNSSVQHLFHILSFETLKMDYKQSLLPVCGRPRRSALP